MEKRSGERRPSAPSSACPVASVTCQLPPIYLIINVFAVESYVNSECGGVVVGDEQGLLVRFVPDHKVQWIGTLMRKDMLVRTQEPMTCHDFLSSNLIYMVQNASCIFLHQGGYVLLRKNPVTYSADPGILL